MPKGPIDLIFKFAQCLDCFNSIKTKIEIRDIYYMTYPLNLPQEWRQVWMYTYTRANGTRQRLILRQILYEGVLHYFRPVDVLTDTLIDKYNGIIPQKTHITATQYEAAMRYMSIGEFLKCCK